VRIVRIDRVNDLVYDFFIDSTSTFFPIVGDSAAVALTGETVDELGNVPAAKAFRVLDGNPPKPKQVRVSVTFPNETMNPVPGASSSGGDPLFIPVTQAGTPFPGFQGNPGANGNFVGPVIRMELTSPTKYAFKIFSTTLGEFVAGGSGEVTQNDFQNLQQIAGGSKYLMRVVWTGRSAQGTQAATGAYVLVANLDVARDTRTGAPASKQIKRVLFGQLRKPGSL
jgi:hypothetical protein